MRRYHQLTQEQRYAIYLFMKEKLSKSEIARRIGVHPSTLSREIKRNTGKKGYRPRQAQKRAAERRALTRRKSFLSEQIKHRIKAGLYAYYSPEQIVGRCRVNNQSMVSVETIYRYIWLDQGQGGQLYRYLRSGFKKKRKSYGKPDKRGQIPNRRWIEEREEIVDKKERIGDYEIDTVTGKGRGAYLLTAVDRKSKYTLIGLCPNKESGIVNSELIKLLKPLRKKAYTITADNGKEFAGHQQIVRQLEVDFYFAHPYHSWERGLNENTNGLIRQFFPKDYDFRTISSEDVNRVISLLNNRPRKTLGFKTPNEVFFEETG